MGSRTRISWLQWGALGVMALFILGAITKGGSDSASTTVTQSFATATTSPTTTTTTSGPTRLAVMRVAREQGLDKAIAVAAVVGADDLRSQFERQAAHILERRARRAFDGGRYETARRVAQSATRRYGSAAAAAPAIRARATQRLADRGAIVIGR